MEIKIGITDINHDVVIDATEDADSVVNAFQDQLGKEHGLVRLTDAKGRLVLIPAARIAYIDLGSPEHRPVGFGALEQ